MSRSTMLRMLVAASLLLNLFSVSYFCGRILRGHLEEDPSALAWILSSSDRALDRRDAAAFRKVLQQQAPRYSDAAAALSRTRTILADRVTANPFDPSSVRSALAAWRSDWNRFNEALSGPLIAALQSISPEGRRRLVRQRQREAPKLQLQ